MAAKACTAHKDDGSPCRAPPLRDSAYCSMHDPAHADEMAEARRLGGLRRRKEKTVQNAFEIEGLETVGQIRRLLEISVMDTLSLENSIARSRTLAYLAVVSLKALEVGEIEDRLNGLEATVHPRQAATTGRRR